jgi:hypothetical protein
MALYPNITPVHELNGVYVKREDLAFWTDLEYPSGSKVRQYFHMAGGVEWINGFYENGKEPPCIVGCSANSAQQIYVAATAKLLKTKAIIYVPARAQRTAATKYCEQMGAEINEVRPGYLSVVRKKTRQRVVDLKDVVQWDRPLAILDTAKQCVNLPPGIKRIIVPSGSGLTAAGVLIGTAGTGIQVVVAATSPMTGATNIMTLATRYLPDKNSNLGPIEFIPPSVPYDKYIIDILPDGTPLDPFYAAKSWLLCKEGDLFWPPGLRPVRAMPEDCQKVFSIWTGPNGIHTS